MNVGLKRVRLKESDFPRPPSAAEVESIRLRDENAQLREQLRRRRDENAQLRAQKKKWYDELQYQKQLAEDRFGFGAYMRRIWDQKFGASMTETESSMTETEYKLIVGCLHPDKHAGEEERYNRALETFRRCVKLPEKNRPC